MATGPAEGAVRRSLLHSLRGRVNELPGITDALDLETLPGPAQAEIDRLAAENERLTQLLCVCAPTIPAEFDPDPACPIHGDPDLDPEAVHGWFGLTYSSYQVLPRVLMQSMPPVWQQRMVALLRELHDAFSHLDQAQCYDVQAAIEVEASSLTEGQLKTMGVTRDWEGDEEDGEFVYHDENGDELESWSRVLVHVAEPLPPYNRGRTKVPTRREAAHARHDTNPGATDASA